jgi:hypothetical protein
MSTKDKLLAEILDLVTSIGEHFSGTRQRVDRTELKIEELKKELECYRKVDNGEVVIRESLLNDGQRRENW